MKTGQNAKNLEYSSGGAVDMVRAILGRECRIMKDEAERGKEIHRQDAESAKEGCPRMDANLVSGDGLRL